MSGLLDYHVHTSFSNDCLTQMAAACEAAISRGIREIAFADHCDFGGFDPSLNTLQVPEYLAEIGRCQRAYGQRLTIRAGIEVGEGHCFPDEAAAVLSSADFDYVLGSLHWLNNLPLWEGRYYADQPLDEGLEAYFAELAELAASADFDVLAHFDIVLRAAYQTFGDTVLDYQPYEDRIRAILRTLVERGKGLEVNTATLRRGMGQPNPPLQVLRWYRELGGEIVTLGSDAHTAASIGGRLETAGALAQAAGFTRLACFEHRKPIFVEIAEGRLPAR